MVYPQVNNKKKPKIIKIFFYPSMIQKKQQKPNKSKILLKIK